MINIFGLEISPYAICFLMSFVVSFIIISFLLKKSGVPGNIIIYSLMLSVVFCIYGAMMYGVIYSGFRKGIMDAGFSSLGGAIGLMVSIAIMCLIYKDGKKHLWDAYLAVLPLFYAISKIGCSIMGCCHGIPYDGILSVSYNNKLISTGKVFPVQMMESLVFFCVFFICVSVYFKFRDYNKSVALILCALAKGLMDFLRDEHIGVTISLNQIICIVFLLIGICLLVKTYKSKTKSC